MVEKQIAIIYAVTKNILSKVAVEDIRAYETGLYSFLDTDPDGAAFMEAVRTTGKLEADTEEHLKKALETYTEKFLDQKKDK